MVLLAVLTKLSLEEIEHKVILGAGFCIVFLIALTIYSMVRHRKKVSIASSNYDAAQASGDRTAALRAGRIYYGLKRRGKPNGDDELAISNDLAAMKERG